MRIHLIESGDGIEDHLDRAFIAATSGKPGPAVLMLPADLHKAQSDKPTSREMRLGDWPLDRPRPDDSIIAEAARLIDGARFPVVIAGGGTHNTAGGVAPFAENAVGLAGEWTRYSRTGAI
jgi:acetolactate synthase I/II/III large subunit